MQLSNDWHGGLQSHVGMHSPLEQINVAAHVLLKQRLVMQLPTPPMTAHTWSSAHCTPSHGPSGRQKMLQAVPAGHSLVHGLMSTQVPLEQNWPVSHTLFKQRLGLKQPATHVPLMQVCCAGQLTPLQGSLRGTQAMLQPLPAGQTVPPSVPMAMHSSV
jgi:hypothetical protein